MIRVTHHETLHPDSVGARLPAVAGAAGGLPIRRVRDNARSPKGAWVQALAASLGSELGHLPGSAPNRNRSERLWRVVRLPSLDSTDYEASEPFPTAMDQGRDGLATVNKGARDTLLTHKVPTLGDGLLLAA